MRPRKKKRLENNERQNCPKITFLIKMKECPKMFKYVINNSQDSLNFNKRIIKAIIKKKRIKSFNMFLDPKFFYTYKKTESEAI